MVRRLDKVESLINEIIFLFCCWGQAEILPFTFGGNFTPQLDKYKS